MTPTIRVDDEVYELLKENAEPFIDTPNAVLRRLLALPTTRNGAGPQTDTEGEAFADGGPTASASTRPRRRGKADGTKKRGRRRAVRGSLVPQSEYELPILQVLVEKGGRAPSREVIDALEPRLSAKLKDVDRSKTSSGEIRWRNRAQFVRLDLVEKGEMAKNSPRGIWEITEAGRRRADEG